MICSILVSQAPGILFEDGAPAACLLENNGHEWHVAKLSDERYVTWCYAVGCDCEIPDCDCFDYALLTEQEALSGNPQNYGIQLRHYSY